MGVKVFNYSGQKHIKVEKITATFRKTIRKMGFHSVYVSERTARD